MRERERGRGRGRGREGEGEGERERERGREGGRERQTYSTNSCDPQGTDAQAPQQLWYLTLPLSLQVSLPPPLMYIRVHHVYSKDSMRLACVNAVLAMHCNYMYMYIMYT